ncbi:cytochrome P450 [Phycicoccus sp. M110.8]|uniref:cytochrome P450 n=1 Tax=Phycicoccus sp. M110.8 TaxID=3075433 RepID=UPI0028FD17B5|nr:cytochrome P450 [Phycicoccus sp. M110.8]MDU0315394.1 cytochrome P450 [Phycicoccus sp. M110.8]
MEDAAVRVFGRTVLEWAGVRLDTREADRVARRLAAVVDGFAVPGPAHLRARWDRAHTDSWAGGIVRDVRWGRVRADPGSILELVAHWTEPSGDLLPEAVAGVELQNLLRPTVAVSRFAAFAALALAQHADWAARLRTEARDRSLGSAVPGEPPTGGPPAGPEAVAFAHEVRRLTPFVPLLAGLTRREVVHRGHVLPAGTRLLLDVVGTNRDARYWQAPLAFDPARFLPEAGGWERDALVPQGGGVVATGHRCPGEDVTLGLVAVTAVLLSTRRWRLPRQDLRVSHHRMPTRPASGVRLVPADDVRAG